MVRTIKQLTAVMLLAIAGMITAGAVASAQTYTCIIVNGVKVIVYTSTNNNSGTSGQGTFNGIIPQEGQLNAQLTVANINANIPDPTYGSVNTTNDPTRTSQPSTITSNTVATRFPATGTIRFFARANLGGVTASYASRQELVFQNSELQQVQPFNATFTLQNDVDFYDINDPTQATVYTLKAGTTNVTLN